MARLLIVCGLSLASAGAATAGPAEVVYEIFGRAPTDAKSLIPGGTSGNPTSRFTNFNNEIHRSPNGQKWMIVATTTDTPNSLDQVFIVGQGLSATVQAQEGVTVINPVDPIPEFINFSGLAVPRINDAGQWAMGFRLNISGATTLDDRFVRFTPGMGFNLILRPNDPIPARNTSFFSGGFSSPSIAQNGQVAFLAFMDFSSGNNDSAFLASGGAFAVENLVTAPINTPDVWQDVDASNFLTDATGTHWIAVGEIGFDTLIDKAVVVDGAVVIREGTVLPGSGFASPVSGVNEGWMEADGTWFVRGSNADSQGWIVRNGVVIAATGLPITPGATETWESFRDFKGDNSGNYVVNGNTNGLGTADDVLVYNGKRVLAREADAVDIDNNGTADTLYLHLIQDRGALLSDDFFYFASRLKDTPTATAGSGTAPNNATLLRVRVCRADFDDSGALSVQDIFDFLNAWFAGTTRANFNGQAGVEVQDIFDFLNAWFAGC